MPISTAAECFADLRLLPHPIRAIIRVDHLAAETPLNKPENNYDASILDRLTLPD